MSVDDDRTEPKGILRSKKFIVALIIAIILAVLIVVSWATGLFGIWFADLNKDAGEVQQQQQMERGAPGTQ